jgi:hypothetical protein
MSLLLMIRDLSCKAGVTGSGMMFIQRLNEYLLGLRDTRTWWQDKPELDKKDTAYSQKFLQVLFEILCSLAHVVLTVWNQEPADITISIQMLTIKSMLR